MTSLAWLPNGRADAHNFGSLSKSVAVGTRPTAVTVVVEDVQGSSQTISNETEFAKKWIRIV